MSQSLQAVILSLYHLKESETINKLPIIQKRIVDPLHSYAAVLKERMNTPTLINENACIEKEPKKENLSIKKDKYVNPMKSFADIVKSKDIKYMK